MNRHFIVAIIALIAFALSACAVDANFDWASEAALREQQFQRDSSNHLRSIREKNIELMKTTLPESGDFFLTLPDGSMTSTVKEFVSGQAAWFESDFTFTTEIIKSEHGPEFGYMLVIAD